jgi:hypothetical protein
MTWLIVLIVVVALVGAAAWMWNRSASLRRHYGPEYDRVIERTGDRRKAEAALRERNRRREALDVRELTPEAHARYTDRWYVVQSHFVDDPRLTLTEAAELTSLVMQERGYLGNTGPEADDADAVDDDRHEVALSMTPVGTGDGFDDPTVEDDVLDLVAVDHPRAVSEYRQARTVHEDGGASTDDLRLAFHGYRSLFDSLMEQDDDIDPGDARARNEIL